MTKTKPPARPDATKRHGAAAIGGRLRRLSERIDEDCARIYADHGIVFEQRWLGVMSQLGGHGAQSVGALAASLGISHASVSETRKSLERAGLIVSKPDMHDGRISILRLSASGRRLFARITRILESLRAVSAEINADAGGALDALDRLDATLNSRSLYDRFKALQLRSQSCEIRGGAIRGQSSG
jgi:DNA-binding MarR family transcriptional regulator